MRKSGLSDPALLDAVCEMAQGLIDADLGGHVVKKRVAPSGQGNPLVKVSVAGHERLWQPRWLIAGFFCSGLARTKVPT